VETNKRALSMQILPKREQALTAWETHCHQVEEESLQGFSEEEKEQFREYLGRMYHNLTGKTLE
ncbi:MAG: MarR family transcriptional regulator, partial [Clostridium sp.]